MKRIVRLNAVENICPEGILGMNQHSLHPNEDVSPQKLIICGVSLASPIFAFLNKLNTNNFNSLFKSQNIHRNIRFNNLLLPELLNKLREVVDFLAFYSELAVLPINLAYQPLTIFNQEDKVPTLPIFLGNRDCEFMCEKVVYTYEDTKTASYLIEDYQVELLWEGKK